MTTVNIDREVSITLSIEKDEEGYSFNYDFGEDGCAFEEATYFITHVAIGLFNDEEVEDGE